MPNYCLTAPKVSPPITDFCKNIKRIKNGKEANVPAAIAMSYGTGSLRPPAAIATIPTGNVYDDSPLNINKGQNKLFQLKIEVIIA